MSAPLKIAFLGSDPIALPLLEWLSRSTSSGQAGGGDALGSIVVAFTQPDRPAGRGQ